MCELLFILKLPNDINPSSKYLAFNQILANHGGSFFFSLLDYLAEKRLKKKRVNIQEEKK